MFIKIQKTDQCRNEHEILLTKIRIIRWTYWYDEYWIRFRTYVRNTIVKYYSDLVAKKGYRIVVQRYVFHDKRSSATY